MGKFKVNGHEKFPCRYTWLPKIVRLLENGDADFSDDEAVMPEMGLGKNMVRSARFWAQVTGVTSPEKSGDLLTDFGRLVLGKDGFDPYLEDAQTLWLIHWNLSTIKDSPLLAWYYMFNKHFTNEIVPSSVKRQLFEEAKISDNELSSSSIDHHFDVFIHTYLPTRGKKGQVMEDNLDSPLVELELLRKVFSTESTIYTSELEPIYTFRNEDKREISSELFAYCVADYWTKWHKSEQTISLQSVSTGLNSPGRVFQLPVEAVRTHLINLSQITRNKLVYQESVQFEHVTKNQDRLDVLSFLKPVYERNSVHA